MTTEPPTPSNGNAPWTTGAARDLLKENPVFSRERHSVLKILLAGATIHEPPPNTRMVTEGKPADRVYALCRGTVRVFHANANGQEVTVKLLHSPCTFAEMEVLANEPLMLESAETIEP